MTPHQAQDLLATLRRQPLSLDEACDQIAAVGSSWSRDQTHLFLSLAPGVERGSDGLFCCRSAGIADELQAALLDVVKGLSGQAAPAALVRGRLPSHLVTTDEQIVALAKRTSGLEVYGPNLIRAVK